MAEVVEVSSELAVETAGERGDPRDSATPGAEVEGPLSRGTVGPLSTASSDGSGKIWCEGTGVCGVGDPDQREGDSDTMDQLPNSLGVWADEALVSSSSSDPLDSVGE